MRLSKTVLCLLLAYGSNLPLSSFAIAAETGVASVAPVPAVKATPKQQAAMRKELQRLLEQFGDGLAVTIAEDPAKILFGPLFDDHQNDAVVLFSLEGFGGGNLHAQFIAFFEEQKQINFAGKMARPYRLVAAGKLGQRGWRSFDFASARLEKHRLSLAGMEMGASDALCCPSVAIIKTFHLDEFDHILEEKQGQAKPEAADKKR